ncbi:MAG: hypothetical protein ACTTJE_08120 [Schwartzia sp. (in: firmicutes)]
MKPLTQPLVAALLAAGLFSGTVHAAPEEEAPTAAEEMTEDVMLAEESPSERESAPDVAMEEEPAPTAEAAPHFVGIPNPMIEYPDVPALERAIGFPVLYLPSNFYALYHPAVHVYGISGQVADLRFHGKADNTTITLRTALEERIFTTDISGVHGVQWQTQSAGDVKRTQVDVATLADGTRVVRWHAGRFVFALSATGFDDASFKPLLKSFVVVADRFSHKYRRFTLNPAKK